MGERGSGSQVSGERIEKCREFVKLLSCVLVPISLCCVALCSPFIEEGKDTGYIRKREEREKEEENRGEEALWDRRVLLLLYAGPADAVDGDRDGCTWGSCSLLVPHLGVINSSSRPIPSRRATRRTGVLVSGRTGSRQHSDHASITVGDVNPLE